MTASDHLGQQFLDLYHRTTPETADQIKTQKQFTSKTVIAGTPAAYFSTDPTEESQATHYGQGMVHVRVPKRLATLDDEFPSGEQHYTVFTHRLRPSHFID